MAITVMVAVVFLLAGCALLGADPPGIPHPVADRYTECKECHSKGLEGAPVTDHIRKEGCQTCHKPLNPGGR